MINIPAPSNLILICNNFFFIIIYKQLTLPVFQTTKKKQSSYYILYVQTHHKVVNCVQRINFVFIHNAYNRILCGKRYKKIYTNETKNYEEHLTTKEKMFKMKIIASTSNIFIIIIMILIYT